MPEGSIPAFLLLILQGKADEISNVRKHIAEQMFNVLSFYYRQSNGSIIGKKFIEWYEKNYLYGNPSVISFITFLYRHNRLKRCKWCRYYFINLYQGFDCCCDECDFANDSISPKRLAN